MCVLCLLECINTFLHGLLCFVKQEWLGSFLNYGSGLKTGTIHSGLRVMFRFCINLDDKILILMIEILVYVLVGMCKEVVDLEFFDR